MGFGNIGWFQILVVLLIVLLIFGTKRIRNLGSDLGGAIREFRKGVSEEESTDRDEDAAATPESESDPSRKPENPDQSGN